MTNSTLAWARRFPPNKSEGWLLTSFLEGFYGIALVCGALWIRRRTGLPLLLALPVLGMALEWIRGNFPWIAFPWLLWGHSQHARGTLIQIADLGSVYAVSGLVGTTMHHCAITTTPYDYASNVITLQVLP